jgi:hypothetical protein
MIMSSSGNHFKALFIISIASNCRSKIHFCSIYPFLCFSSF